jgi:hypothetical protein
MKVVQTEVSDTEHALLAEYAKAHKTTIKEAVREAIRKLTLRDQVDPGSPIFTMFPLTRKKGRHEDASERHDFYLYGWDK